MKSEKEAILLVKLRNCKFVNKNFGSVSGCKRDFEVELGISENDKEFRRWLNLLISDGILEIYEKKSINIFNKITIFYVVNRNKALERLKNNETYINFKKDIDSEELFSFR